MPDLLLELRSEEIPARMQATGAESLRLEVEKRLKAQALSGGKSEAFATSRRLALIVRGLPDGIPAGEEELRGPRVSATYEAVEGFLRSAGVARTALEKRGEGPKASWFVTREIPARTIDDVLAEILPDAIRAVRWPKSMRWGRGNFRWVRPLRGILCIVGDGDTSRPVALDIEGIPCGAITRGHPYLAPEEFTVKSVGSYESQLKQARVNLQAEDRCEKIHLDVDKAAKKENLELVSDPDLVEEIARLVEWPVVFIDRIEKAFFGLPDALLRISMRRHQKFLSLQDPESKRIAGFAGVADIESTDGGAQIQAGYRRVLRARLKDALFFWENDRRMGLAAMRSRLSGMVFHESLGTMEARTQRIAWLAAQIAPAFSINPDWAYRAGELAKADLCSETVREFPELQGIVGGLLAADAKEDPEVVVSIARQYRTEDSLVDFGFGFTGEVGSDEFLLESEGDLGRAAATLILADRIDMLWGFFAAGKRPTSSRDPYALRRAALVVLRTLIENERPFSLRGLFDLAEHGYDKYGDMPSMAREDASSALQKFMLERLCVDLRHSAKYGFRHDIVTAAALRGTEDSPLQLKRRAETLNLLFVNRLDPSLSKQADAMLSTWRRCASILDAEGEPEDCGVLDRSLYHEPEELSLIDALEQVQELHDHWLNYTVTALNELEELRKALDKCVQLYKSLDGFFEKLHVNDPHLGTRKKRLCLLAQVRATLEKVADFGAIEG